VGDPAPHFVLNDLDGRPISLSDLHGSESVLLFWNPACGFL
jgi:peroxiredoxin